MNKGSGLWMLPYFIAALIWMLLYKRTDSLAHLYVAGKQNPIIFILIIGMLIHMITGLIREWHRS